MKTALAWAPSFEPSPIAPSSLQPQGCYHLQVESSMVSAVFGRDRSRMTAGASPRGTVIFRMPRKESGELAGGESATRYSPGSMSQKTAASCPSTGVFRVTAGTVPSFLTMTTNSPGGDSIPEPLTQNLRQPLSMASCSPATAGVGSTVTAGVGSTVTAGVGSPVTAGVGSPVAAGVEAGSGLVAPFCEQPDDPTTTTLPARPNTNIRSFACAMFPMVTPVVRSGPTQSDATNSDRSVDKFGSPDTSVGGRRGAVGQVGAHVNHLTG